MRGVRKQTCAGGGSRTSAPTLDRNWLNSVGILSIDIGRWTHIVLVRGPLIRCTCSRTSGRGVVHVMGITLGLVIEPVAGVLRTSVAISTATTSTATLASTVPTAALIVLAGSVFKTLTPGVVHARMERALGVRIRADVET